MSLYNTHNTTIPAANKCLFSACLQYTPAAYNRFFSACLQYTPAAYNRFFQHAYNTHLQHTSYEEGDDTAGCLSEGARVGGFTDPYGVVLYLGQVKKGGHS